MIRSGSASDQSWRARSPGMLLVLVTMNSDVSDSWEREGDNRDYFETFSGRGYALGVNVAVWVMTH